MSVWKFNVSCALQKSVQRKVNSCNNDERYECADRVLFQVQWIRNHTGDVNSVK